MRGCTAQGPARADLSSKDAQHPTAARLRRPSTDGSTHLRDVAKSAAARERRVHHAVLQLHATGQLIGAEERGSRAAAVGTVAARGKRRRRRRRQSVGALQALRSLCASAVHSLVCAIKARSGQIARLESSKGTSDFAGCCFGARSGMPVWLKAP